jgi:hypothetical protein
MLKSNQPVENAYCQVQLFKAPSLSHLVAFTKQRQKNNSKNK